MQTDRSIFATAARFVARAVEKRPTMPVLGMVRVEAHDGTLTLTATDLTTVVRASVPCTGDVPACGVDAASLVRAVGGKAPKGATVDVECVAESSGTGRTLRVAGASLPAYAAKDFPILTGEKFTPDGDSRIVVYDGARLADALAFVASAASDDATRPHLNGVLFDGTRLVATNGHMLHLLDGGPAVPVPTLLPTRGVGLLGHALRATGSKGVVVARFYGPHAVVFRAVGKGLTLDVRCKPTDAQFPPWAAVIPQSNDVRVRVDTGALRDALVDARRFAPDRTHGVALVIGGALAVETNNPDTGSFTRSVPCEHDGENRRVGVCADYMLAALDGIEGRAALAFGGDLDPIRVEGEGMAERVAVVMPMRI